MPAKTHTMHGRDHCPGGADPIPCMPDLSSHASYPDLIQAHPCLVHYWPCDETTGDLLDRQGGWDLAVDTSTVSSPVTGTYPQYGTAGPLPELPELTAVVNAGVEGFGANEGRFFYDFVTAPAMWTNHNPFAIELWAYLDQYPAVSADYLLSVGTPAGNELNMYIFTNKLYFARGGTSVHDPSVFPLDSWQHIVVSYDGATLSLYRNGALVDSVATAVNFTVGGTFALLNRFVGTTSWNPFNGRAAQLALYDCALTVDEVGDHSDARDTSGEAPAGYVLTSDGEGGYTWEAIPTSTATKDLEIKVIDDTTTLTTGDGKIIFAIPASLGGCNLTAAHAFVTTVSSSGLPTVQIRNVTQTADMLTTKITIDASEFTSYTAATAPVVDTGNDDVATGDLIAVDVDVAGTGAKGLGVILTFTLP